MFARWIRLRVLCCSGKEEEGGEKVKRCRVTECPEREIRSTRLRIRLCQQCESLGLGRVDRDINRAINMRDVVRHYAENGVRPDWNTSRGS